MPVSMSMHICMYMATICREAYVILVKVRTQHSLYSILGKVCYTPAPTPVSAPVLFAHGFRYLSCLIDAYPKRPTVPSNPRSINPKRNLKVVRCSQTTEPSLPPPSIVRQTKRTKCRGPVSSPRQSSLSYPSCDCHISLSRSAYITSC